MLTRFLSARGGGVTSRVRNSRGSTCLFEFLPEIDVVFANEEFWSLAGVCFSFQFVCLWLARWCCFSSTIKLAWLLEEGWFFKTPGELSQNFKSEDGRTFGKILVLLVAYFWVWVDKIKLKLECTSKWWNKFYSHSPFKFTIFLFALKDISLLLLLLWNKTNWHLNAARAASGTKTSKSISLFILISIFHLWNKFL